MAHNSLLEAIGESPDAAARSLLNAMRSSEDMTPETLAKALGQGGVDMETAQKALLFEKALGACGADPEDVAKALLLQKALVAGGVPPSVAAKLMKEITSKGKLSQEEAEAMLREMAEGDLNYDDVMKGLKLDKTLAGPKGVDLELVQEVMQALGKNPTKEALIAASEKLANSFGVESKAAASAAALQKVMAELGVEASDVTKILAVQKKMYESGASPQDIALAFQAAFDSGEDDDENGGTLTPEELKKREAMLDALTASVLNSSLSPSDIAAGSDLADAAGSHGIPAEMVKSVAMMQKTIEAALKSPERSAREAAAKIRAGGGSEGEVAEAVRDLLEENDLSPEALTEGVLMQKAMTALGIKAEDFAGVMKLQQSMLDSGKSKLDVTQVLESLISKGGSDVKEMANSLLSALDSGGNRLREEDLSTFSDIIAALEAEGGDKDTLAKLRQALAGSKTRANMADVVEKAMTEMGVSHDALAKVVLLQKVMADAGAKCSPEDLAKLCRMQKALADAGVPQGAVPRALTSILDEEKASPADKARSRLKEVSRSGKLEVKSDVLDFSSKFGDALDPNNQHSDEDVRQALETSAEAAGLTGDDLARAMLVQKTLAATGVSPEAMSQLVMLQKTLAAAGKNPDEIAQFLSDAVGKGLSEKDVADIMNSALSNPDLTEEDVKKMMKLQESMQKGLMQVPGVSPEKLKEVLKLQSVLENSGMSKDEVGELMNKITSGKLDEKAVGDIMAKALDGKNLNKEDLSDIAAAKSSLKDGSLAGLKVDSSTLKQLSALKENLQSAGVSSSEIESILEKISSGALGEEEAKKILEKLETKDSSMLDGVGKKIAEDLGDLLTSNKLQSTNLKAENVDLLLTLSSALESMGKSNSEIQEIISKVVSGELSRKEMNDLINDLEESGAITQLPENLKKKLPRLTEALKSNDLQVKREEDRETLDEVMLLAKVLSSSGESADDISKLVEKAMTKGLSSSEANKAVKKVKEGASSSSLALSEKEVMGAVKKVLSSDSSSLSNTEVNSQELDKLLKLSDALSNVGGRSKEEVASLVQKAAQGTLSKKEVDALVKDLAAAAEAAGGKGSGVEAEALRALCDSIKSGDMKVKGKVDANFAQDISLLSDVLDSAGLSAEEKRELIKQKVTGSGLGEEDVDKVLGSLGEKVGKMVEAKKQLSALEKALKSGDLQTSGLKSDSADKVALLGEALSAAGLGDDEAAEFLSKAAKGELGDREIAEVMNKLSDNKDKLPDAVKERLADVEKTIREGASALAGIGDLSKEALKDTVALARAMKKAGVSDEEIKKVLSKATGEGLTEKETTAILKKVMDSPQLSKEEKNKMKEVEQSLKKGKLRACQVSDDAVGATMALQDALKTAGLDDKEISNVIASMASKKMSDREVQEMLKEVAKTHGFDEKKTKDILKAAEDVSKTGGLQMPNACEENIEQMLFLKKVLEASGASKEKVAETLAKAVNQGLTKGEIGDIVKKATSSKNLSKEEKAKLSQLQTSLEKDELKAKGGPTGATLSNAIATQKLLEESGMSPEEVADVMAKVAKGEKLGDDVIDGVVKEVLKKKDVSQEDFKAMSGILESLQSGKLKVPGLSPEITDQVVLLKRAMEASGYSDKEIEDVVAKATGQQGLSDTATSELMSRLMSSEKLSEEDKEKMSKLQKDLRDGSMRIGGSAEDLLAGLMAGADPEALAKALLAQKILARSGLDQDDLGKVVMLQKSLMESGASPEKVAKAMKDALALAAGEGGPDDVGTVLRQMEEELKAAVAAGGGDISAADVAGALQFEKVLGASRAADIAMRKLPPKQRKLLEQLIKGEGKEDISGGYSSRNSRDL